MAASSGSTAASFAAVRRALASSRVRHADVVGALEVEVGSTEQANGHGGIGLGGFRSPHLDLPTLIAGLEDQRLAPASTPLSTCETNLVFGDLHARR